MTAILIMIVISWVFWGYATTKNKKNIDTEDLEDYRVDEMD